MNRFRKYALLGIIVCLGALLGALLLEHLYDLEPCPLCLLTRWVVGALILGFIVSSLHNPKALGQKAYASFIALFSILGGGISGRHLWLQSLPPDQAPACGPNLEYLMDTLPLKDVLAHIVQGAGECASVQWQFLGLSLPGWSMVLFVLTFLLAILMAFKGQP